MNAYCIGENVTGKMRNNNNNNGMPLRTTNDGGLKISGQRSRKVMKTSDEPPLLADSLFGKQLKKLLSDKSNV